MRSWLLLTYKLPAQPTAQRVHVWRKLKRLQAYLMGGVWVLPHTPRNEEETLWLAAEISELGGQTMLWQAQALSKEQEAALVSAFTAETDAAYREIIAALAAPGRDLAALIHTYRQTLARDLFSSPWRAQARAALAAAREEEYHAMGNMAEPAG